jgi:hypothetical protein
VRSHYQVCAYFPFENVHGRGLGIFGTTAREELHASLSEIGRRLGGRGHTTVLNGWRHASALMITDEDFREKVERARAEFLAAT